MSKGKGLEQQVPSPAKLFKASAVALAIAALILITVVLPAEYGLDLLGTGAALGLMVLSAAPVAAEEIILPANGALTPVQTGPAAYYGGEYQLDSVELTL